MQKEHDHSEKIKFIKDSAKLKMSQERLTNLAVLAIESNIVGIIDLDIVIRCVSKKARIASCKNKEAN